MAWATPTTFNETMVTAAILHAQIKDNLTALSQHTHSGAAGDGSKSLTIPTLTGQDTNTWASGSVPATAGQLSRVSNTWLYHNGSAVVDMTADSATYASRRTLGTAATQAAAGNHTH